MKVAVLGAGGMGGTVIEHLQECEQVGKIVAYDIREERVQELREKYGIQSVTNLEKILAELMDRMDRDAPEQKFELVL